MNIKTFITNLIHRHIYLPYHYSRLRRLVIKRREKLNRDIRISIVFDTQKVQTNFTLYVKHIPLFTSADGFDYTDMKQLAHALRLRTRHTIDYSKL